MDPYLYVLLHKYQHLAHIERAEKERLIQTITRPSPEMQRIHELAQRLTAWRTHWLRRPHESPAVEDKVVIY